MKFAVQSQTITCRNRSAGSALLLILGCVALLTILVISFFASARSELSTANFYAKGVSTKLLSENVINLVMAQLREGARSTDVNSPTTALAWASQPGMIRSYGTDGRPYKYYKLYSWDNMIAPGQYQSTDTPPAGWSALPNIYTDLNEPVNSRYPILDPTVLGSVEGFSYTTAPDTTTAQPLPMPVKWLYVLKNGSLVTGSAGPTATSVNISGATVNNPVVGRVAFWTDDETCKVNINTASEGIFWDTPVGNGADEIGSLSGNGATINAPYGFSTSIPAAEEFQRTPGHPATTSLSAVFGYGAGAVLPDTRSPLLSWPLTPATYGTNFAPYYTLTPRYQAGGSMGGAQPPVAGFGLSDYRLYDSVDELEFDPNRIAVTSKDAGLYPGTTGASPTGRNAIALTPTLVDRSRFFITAHSRAPEETLFGTPRISLWPVQATYQDPVNGALQARTAKDNLLAFCSTLTVNNGGTPTAEPYYFQRATYYQYLQKPGGVASTVPQSACSSQSSTMDFPTSPNSVLSSGPATVTRNENLYAYLQALTSKSNPVPGFGGSLEAKYSAGSGGEDRDEILTEMFDLLRSGVNTFNVGTGIYPNYTYTPYYYTGASQPGCGSTVPVSIPSNGTHGLGRTYTIAEVSLVFMASAINLNSGGPGGTPAPVAAGIANPANPNQMSIGPNLPWACAIDYPAPLATPTFFDYSASTGSPSTYTAATVPPASSKMVTIADPQTTAVQAFLIVRPYNLVPGIPPTAPNVRIRVSNLDQLTLNGTSMSFPTAGEAVAVLNSENNAGGFPLSGLTEPILGHPLGPNDGTNSNFPWYTPTPISVPLSTPSPFGGEDPLTISPVQIHPLVNAAGAYGGSTMSVNGTTLKIDVLDGVTVDPTKAQVIETVYVKIPAMTLPVPTVEMANGLPYHQQEDEACGPALNFVGPRLAAFSDNPFVGSPPGSTYQAPSATVPNPNPTYTFGTCFYYWQLPYDIRSIGNRFAGDYTRIINRGDVVRSFVVNPATSQAGDMRLFAATPIRPQPPGYAVTNPVLYPATDDFVPLGSSKLVYTNTTQGPYTSLFIKQLHSLMMETGNYRDIMNLVATSQSILSNPISQLVMLNTHGGQFGGGMGETNGALFQNETYAPASAPDATPELNGAFMSPGVPGDWSTGMGPSGDGPFVIKPDEGVPVGYGGSIYFDPYYTTNFGNTDFSTSLATYSPNRQVPSPLIFGTLPSRALQGQPWCTLLFCPNPAANDAGVVHPGFGSGSGVHGPGDVPPYTTPPDHLFLDLFWMPVVEPYAISEPFSTAGKVNMNYQIVPFSYIHRSTALHAVMKSTQILAIPADGIANGVNANGGTPLPTISVPQPPASGPNIKPFDFYMETLNTFSYRYQINLVATIDDANSAFQLRFGQQDIFRSASEFCNVFLVPQAIPGKTYFSNSSQPPMPSLPTDASFNSMTTWWKNFKLTGDNSRESPYSQIYPRLTTKSNTFEVHMRVQVLTQTPADRATGTFNTAVGDSVMGEYRGSALVERYFDPNQTNPPLPDFATTFPADPTSTLDNYVHYRVVSVHAFSP